MTQIQDFIGHLPGSLDEEGEIPSTIRARIPAGRELCYESSKWGRYLWDSRRASSSAVASAVNQVAKPLVDKAEGMALRGVNRDAILAAREEGQDMARAFGAEVFERLYGDPARLDDVGGWASQLHDALNQLPEWNDLRGAVAGDPDFAAMATKDMLQAVAGRLPDLLKEADQEAQEQGKPGQRKPPVSAVDMARGALRGACRQALKSMVEKKEAMEGMVPGTASKPAAEAQKDTRRLALAERIGQDARLRRILALAGRLQRIADQRRRTRNEHAREEVVDIERGNDVARLLPSGLAALRHLALRRVALRNILERQALQYRLEGSEPEGRGPIVVLLDESGSMEGEPHEWARAVGIACIGTAARERRACTVVGFDAGIRSVVHLDASGRGWKLPVLNSYQGTVGSPVSMGGVVDVVLHVASQDCPGGTDFTPALRLALDGLPSGIRDPRADLVFVTDGCAEASDSVMADLEKLKAGGLRVHGLTVNGGRTSGAMARICTDMVDLDGAQDKAGKVGNALP